MDELFHVGSSDEGVNIDTVKVDSDGDNIENYGKSLLKVLNEFDFVMHTLTSKGMHGYMSDEAMKSYKTVKDSLEGYAASLIETGAAVKSSAKNLSTASIVSGDNISVFNS